MEAAISSTTDEISKSKGVVTETENLMEALGNGARG
jgi:hypothetical protein